METTFTEPQLVDMPAVQPLSFLAIIDRAVAKNIDPDALGKLLDVQERYHDWQAREAYNRDFVLCCAKMPRIPQTAKGQHGRYSPYDDMDRLIRPIYTEFGFSLEFSHVPEKSTATEICYRCTILHRQGHSRETFGVYGKDGIGPKGEPTSMNRTQATGSTDSYAKRYIAKNVFALSEAGEDDDAAGARMAGVITREQMAQLNDLLMSTSSNLDGFLKWAECERLDLMPAGSFAKALQMLQAKAKAKGQAAKKAGG